MIKMNKMPLKLKKKLIQINTTARKVAELGEEFDEIIINEYGLDLDMFYQSEFGEDVSLINIIN
jgi:hypothetical protein